ncbi:Sua5/YciO/YrdC/YwlC family protein [Mycoplasma elephantis]|uniref:Sua5/YciO/YrdC/YwlC family protein n=1 Tax=Mycoplasma elephantis TaxID=114882 RepID=UPI000562EE26|nr:Sua5/YciO/YrdC/YwlC family protein [Mycoplasma elephantis]
MQNFENINKIWLITTDTVCGIGSFVKDNLVKELNLLKGRDESKKIIILVGSIEQASMFKSWNNKATKWAKTNWPGAHSIIVNNEGFRMPNSKKLCDFLLKNGPMHVTSANLTKKMPLDFDAAKRTFKTIKNHFECCNPNGKPSSIFDLEKGIYLRK